MKICGIIAEYNPFHAGHAHHIQMTKQKTGCDHVVCLMSGSFVQRGEPAIFDKWHRAKAAVLNGADLVLELPTIYALRSAEGFAYGAVRILHDLGLDILSFGSETDDIKALKSISDILLDEPDAYRQYLKAHLSRGLSFPVSRGLALTDYMGSTEASLMMAGSNAILGIEYLKALGRLNSQISPTIVKRTGDDYNEQMLSPTLSSATAIRKHIAQNGLDDLVYANVPDSAYQVYADLVDKDFYPVYKQLFFKELIYEIRKTPATLLANILDVTEGLENKIKKAAQSAKTFDDLVDNIKSKRYTRTRIQRVLCYILLGITKQSAELADKTSPKNIKVLAYKKDAKHLLSHFTKNTDLNLFHSSVGLQNDAFVKLDMRATDIYSLSQVKQCYYKTGQDYTQKTLTD